MAKASRGFSSISETVIDIWVRIVRLYHPRNATNARTLFVIRQKYDDKGTLPLLPLSLLQKPLREPFAHREVVELQASIGKREGPDESEQHVRKAFGKRRLMVEGPRRIDID